MGIGFGITFTIVALGVAWNTRRRGHLLLDTGVLEQPVLTRNLADYVPLMIALVGVWAYRRFRPAAAASPSGVAPTGDA